MTDFNFIATGIGSVPFTDIEGTCENIIRKFPHAPFWPQFVKVSHLEDMVIQYSEGLPLLEIMEDKRALRVTPNGEKEEELVKFYDHLLSDDTAYFSMTREYASGLYAMTDLIREKAPSRIEFVKGQTVGPVTFAASISDTDGKMILHNAELLEAMARGLAIKAVWQARQLEKTGAKVIIFLDEPYLSGFGPAFSAIQRHEVIELLSTIIDYVRKNSNALLGIHCCGNTDWAMLLESGPDIINFDAFGYMEHFFLYPDAISAFIKKGGVIAWGIVPTFGFTGKENTDGLHVLLDRGLDRLSELGIDHGLIPGRSILTPACGMGTMQPQAAEKSMAILSDLSDRLRDEFLG
jgi:methionine synthase II (cobalamin-independent)